MHRIAERCHLSVKRIAEEVVFYIRDNILVQCKNEVSLSLSAAPVNKIYKYEVRLKGKHKVRNDTPKIGDTASVKKKEKKKALKLVYIRI